MARLNQVGWAKIEPLYRSGHLSIREIAREIGVTETAVRKHAKKHNWKRDLIEEVRAKTREKFVEDLAAAGSQGSVIGDESLQQPVRVQTEEETTEQAALTQIHVLRDQRKTIGGGHKITLRLLDELDIASAHVDDLKTMIVQETIDDPKARTAMLKAVSLPGRAAVMRDLAQAARTWVGLERQAFGIVEEKRDPNKPIDSENLSAAELLAEIAQEMQQLGVTPEMLALPRPMADVIEGVANKPVGANGANGKDKH